MYEGISVGSPCIVAKSERLMDRLSISSGKQNMKLKAHIMMVDMNSRKNVAPKWRKVLRKPYLSEIATDVALSAW
jgi:hypothetical protein